MLKIVLVVIVTENGIPQNVTVRNNDMHEEGILVIDH